MPKIGNGAIEAASTPRGHMIVGNILRDGAGLRLKGPCDGTAIMNNVLLNGAWIKLDGLSLFGPGKARPVVDCQPNGKWRVGSTVGKVPAGHNCVIEGFLVRKGKTVRKGTVAYVPNGGAGIDYILRGNDIG
jgi:hypothetical protein